MVIGHTMPTKTDKLLALNTSVQVLGLR